MTDPSSKAATPQGFQPDAAERIPIPARESMNDAQRASADAIIAGPRKAIFGPFVPLLQTPALLERIGSTGEAALSWSTARLVRELVILLVARETGNQFEWQTHAPLARRAGLEQETIAAIADGRHPRCSRPSTQIAAEFASELMRRNGVSDTTFQQAAGGVWAAGRRGADGAGRLFHDGVLDHERRAYAGSRSKRGTTALGDP